MDHGVVARERGKQGFVTHRRPANSERATALVDHLGKTAEEAERRLALHGRDLAGEALGQRDIIGIEARDERRARHGKPGIERRDNSHGPLACDHDPRIAARGLRKNCGRRIARAVVDGDKLEIRK